MDHLAPGLYERLVDEELQQLLEMNPELRPILTSLDDEAAPHSYAQFLAQVMQKALRSTPKEQRVALVNRLIELISATDGQEYLTRRRLLERKHNLLTEISSTGIRPVRPATPLSVSSLLTGQGGDPPLEHELRAEMATADRVDILISFIKWSGLRLLIPAFERLKQGRVPVRILSTSYMGASDPAALEWLARQPNVSVRLSYDTGGTRLHAKAYHFVRDSGYSTAYIGSANMSHAAMTQGLEWTLKVTAQDMPHILDRFVAEFSAYWQSPEFEPYSETEFKRFRRAIDSFRSRGQGSPQFFAEITPRPFQLRILDALEAARNAGSHRNLVVAATGTGKTVISALDYQRVARLSGDRPTLLFVVHRKEILQQAMDCFRTVLRDQNFGELMVDGQQPSQWQHVFASVQSLNQRQPWARLGQGHFRFIVIDEAHHGAANSYRPLFEHLGPDILLGLTATPERMDGSAILPDFDDRFAAEIRLPEALEEKLLCPFHYFGVADSIDLSDERFWRNGRYNATELENVFTGDDFRARQRVDLILQALDRYQPEREGLHGVGFCAGVKHAEYMANHFELANIPAATLLGDTPREIRAERLQAFRRGEISFLFTVDVLSEGVDVPEINLVLFLRPTESLTVFLQQLGRGLRHAPGKDCLTVLDFVGQTHRRYRIDTKLTALLSRTRQRIDREIENDFPNLPPGCSIQLERVARERILTKIRSVLNDLKHFIPETLRTWEQEISKPLTFGQFIDETGLSPIDILSKKTWSEWKAMAFGKPKPRDPDIDDLRTSLSRISLRTDPEMLAGLIQLVEESGSRIPEEKTGIGLHYLLWNKTGAALGINSVRESIGKWRNNPGILADTREIADWRRRRSDVPVHSISLPFPCDLKLHAAYGSAEIKAALGLASLQKPGPTGQGVMHASGLKAYVHLVTFNKDERAFSPTTRYRDYPISPTHLHWESQSITSQHSDTGQNYVHFKRRGYTILFFARVDRKVHGETAPFIYLGPASKLISYEGERPISMVWELAYPMPAHLLEAARLV